MSIERILLHLLSTALAAIVVLPPPQHDRNPAANYDAGIRTQLSANVRSPWNDEDSVLESRSDEGCTDRDMTIHIVAPMVHRWHQRRPWQRFRHRHA